MGLIISMIIIGIGAAILSVFYDTWKIYQIIREEKKFLYFWRHTLHGRGTVEEAWAAYNKVLKTY